MKSEIKVKFCILGTKLTPEEITNLIGISPTKSWNAGEHVQIKVDDVVKELKIKRKENAWCLEAKPDLESNDFRRPLKQLLQILSPKADLIKKMCHDFDLECELGCVIYIQDEPPILTIPSDVLSELAMLK